MSRALDIIRKNCFFIIDYRLDFVTICQIYMSFLEHYIDDYYIIIIWFVFLNESAVRNAASLGSEADTMACRYFNEIKGEIGYE